MTKNISLIISVYNESAHITETLQTLEFDKYAEVIVVNDGSSDDTVEKVTDFPVFLLNFIQNRGKGFAVQKGLEAASGDIIVLSDGDLGSSISEIEKLIAPVLNNETPVAVAVIPVQAGGLGLVRFLAHRGVYLLTGQKLRAPLSGQRCFRREVLEIIIPLAPGFGLEVGMDIDLLKKGCQIQEVETEIQHRVTGQSVRGYWHRWGQFKDLFITLVQKFLYVC